MPRRQWGVWIKNLEERAGLEMEVWLLSAWLWCSVLPVAGRVSVQRATPGGQLLYEGGKREVPEKAKEKGGQSPPPQAMVSWCHALSCMKNQELALAGVAQLVGAPSCNQRVAGLTPGRDTDLGFGFAPPSGCI